MILKSIKTIPPDHVPGEFFRDKMIAFCPNCGIITAESYIAGKNGLFVPQCLVRGETGCACGIMPNRCVFGIG